MNFYYAPGGFIYPHNPYLPPMIPPYYPMEEREPNFYNRVEDLPVENPVPMNSESNTPQGQVKKQRTQRKRRRTFQARNDHEKIQKEDRNYFSNSMKIFLKYIKDLK